MPCSTRRPSGQARRRIGKGAPGGHSAYAALDGARPAGGGIHRARRAREIVSTSKRPWSSPREVLIDRRSLVRNGVITRPSWNDALLRSSRPMGADQAKYGLDVAAARTRYAAGLYETRSLRGTLHVLPAGPFANPP